MKTLKFSSDYEKLPLNWEGTTALLIGVFPVEIDWLRRYAPAFFELDTRFRGDKSDGSGHYDIQFKNGLILSFIHLETGIPFTTIRRNYEEKLKYYTKSIGETFVLQKRGD